MQADDPFNVELLNVDEYVAQFRVQPVTTLSFYAPSSGNSFAPEGLFSETIFGPLGTADRLVTFGYIQLNTAVLQPLIYKNVIKLAALYEEIMSGKAYAIFDETTRDFVRCDKPDNYAEAGTGYSFFMRYFNAIVFKRNESSVRSDRIGLVERYHNILFCDKFLVMPAGLRDLSEDQGMVSTDDINKLYQTLLSYSFSIPPNTTNTIFDGVRLAIQLKIVEIYDYIENILTGKRGFIQGAWGHRRIALGTRNVITAASYATMTPNDPQALQPDETKLGIFQSAKALQPLVVHHIRTNFFTPIFGEGSNTVALTDPKTYQLAYRDLSNQELSRFDSPEAIEDWITRFQNIDVRVQPVTVHDVKGLPFYLLMVYDEGDQISLFRSLEEFQKVRARKPLAVIVKGNPKYLNMPANVPLAEAFYTEIQTILEKRGYDVAFDPGIEYTSPDETAAVWIGHSRGIDRLRFAPATVKTIALQTEDHTKSYASHDERGVDPLHYKLSAQDRQALALLPRPSNPRIDRSKIRPLTWAELFYMATFNAAAGKHVLITRYPVIQDESCYPTKVHLVSTMPSRVVKLMNTIQDVTVFTYPEYPILGRPFLDSVQLGTARLKGLDGDYDGDTVSANIPMSIEANAEIHDFLGSLQSIVNAQKEILIGGRDDLIAYTLRALSSTD